MMGKSPERLFTAAEAAEVCSGYLLENGYGRLEISSVIIDSRKGRRGALFVPLKGEQSDGHAYIPDALASGASCVLVASSWKEQIDKLSNTTRAAFIIVEDPLRSLQKLAQWWTAKFPELVRIGVTGSSGKTTTKEILRSILSVGSNTKANEGNLNSEIGLPLSLFSLQKEDRYGVFEMGINFKGEMDILADIYKPQFAVITNIGTAHSGPLGGVEGILREKTKVFTYFSSESRAFLPENDPRLEQLQRACGGRFVLFGKNSTRSIDAVENRGLSGWDFTYKGERAHLALPGEFNLSNMYAAVTAAEYFDVPSGDIIKGIAAVSPLSGRSRILTGRVTIIEDSYNANADSTCKILEFLNGITWQGRKIAVLGSMKELGADSKELHTLVGRKICGTDMDAVFMYGEETGNIYRYLRDNNFPGYFFYTEEYDELQTELLDFVSSKDLVLLKGSRSMKLERLVPFLQSREAVRNV